MKTLAALLLLLPMASRAQLGTTNAMMDAGSLPVGNRCVPIYRSAWLPQANNLQVVYHFDGSGTITNGATVPGEISGTNATATIASSTLSYSAHPASPAVLSKLRQYLVATGTAGDIISAGSPAGITDMTAATWSMWVKVGIPATNPIRLFYKSNNNASAGWHLILRTGGEFELHKVHNTTNLKIQTCPTSSSYITSSTWHHVVAVWDGTSAVTGLKVYLDGTELISTGVADTRLANAVTCTNWSTNGGYTSRTAGAGGWASDASNNLNLAGKPGSSATNPDSDAFTGSMDEFAIWNKALTAAEIATLYKHQKCN